MTISANDVIIAMIHANLNGLNFTDNNGAYAFTKQFEETNPNGGESSTYAIYYRVAGASEPSSYSWNVGASTEWSVQIRAFSGVDTSSVWDVAPSGSTRSYAGADTTATAPSMTTLTNGAWGIAAFFSDSLETFSNPTNGYGGEVEPPSRRAQASYIRTWATAGPTGTTSATLSATNDWVAHQFALKPASAATWAANEDTKLTGLAKSTPKRVRLEVSNEGGSSSGGVTYQLEVSGPNPASCAAASYNAVPTAATGHWQIVGSSYSTDGQATENVTGGLTDESTTFIAGQLKDAGATQPAASR